MRGTGLWVGAMGLVGAGVTAAAAAAPVTVTPPVSKDNTLIQDANGTLSNGRGPLFAGRTNQAVGSNIRRALIAFDLSSIPAGATVTSATLQLSAFQTRAFAETDMSLHRVTRDWGEGTSNGSGSGALATTGDATWLHTFFPGSTWTSAGGDFVQAASATTRFLGVGDKTWTGAQMVADVQGWLANPASNFGWALTGDESANFTSYEFGSRESGVGKPVLTVTYDVAVPEPGTASLLLLAAAPWLAGRGRSKSR